MPAECQFVLSCFRAFARAFFASPEGGGAPIGATHIGHLRGCPACRVTGRRAFRRSTAAILGPITVSSFTGPEACTSRDPGSIAAALHPMLSKPLKAGPSSGPDGDRASWDEVTSLACRRRLPAPPTERLRKTPSVNGVDKNVSGTYLCVKRTFR